MNVKSIDKANLRELTELLAKVEAAIEPARQREKAAVMEEIKAIAQTRGLSVQDILGKSSKSHAMRPRDIIRYRNPSNPDQVWSGRGRPPRWIEGKEKGQFAVAAFQPTK